MARLYPRRPARGRGAAGVRQLAPSAARCRRRVRARRRRRRFGDDSTCGIGGGGVGCGGTGGGIGSGTGGCRDRLGNWLGRRSGHRRQRSRRLRRALAGRLRWRRWSRRGGPGGVGARRWRLGGRRRFWLRFRRGRVPGCLKTDRLASAVSSSTVSSPASLDHCLGRRRHRPSPRRRLRMAGVGSATAASAVAGRAPASTSARSSGPLRCHRRSLITSSGPRAAGSVRVARTRWTPITARAIPTATRTPTSTTTVTIVDAIKVANAGTKGGTDPIFAGSIDDMPTPRLSHGALGRAPFGHNRRRVGARVVRRGRPDRDHGGLRWPLLPLLTHRAALGVEGSDRASSPSPRSSISMASRSAAGVTCACTSTTTATPCSWVAGRCAGTRRVWTVKSRSVAKRGRNVYVLRPASPSHRRSVPRVARAATQQGRPASRRPTRAHRRRSDGDRQRAQYRAGLGLPKDATEASGSPGSRPPDPPTDPD